MASTYSSNLYIELIATGEQAGTWGTSTNNNFTNVFEEAIVGRVSVPFSDADVTLTATASNTNQSFRNVYLNCTGTNTASRNLVVPTINKNYIVENNTTGGFSIVVKTSAGTGITVPNGTKCAVYVDGTNVVIAFNYLSTLTVGTLSLTNALTTASGGTGLSSYTAGDLPYYASGTALSKLAIGTNGQILTSSGTAPQWSTLSGVAVTTFQTSLSGLTPSTATAGAVTLAGTLGTSSGGTGLTAFTANQIFYASSTSAIAQSSNLTFNGTTLTANTLNLTNALGVAYGGTGLTTLTSGYIPYGNGTSAFSSASTLSYSSTSGLTVNGITQAYNTTLYNVDGTLSNYASNNAVYLNGNAGGWLLLSGDGTRNQSIKLNGGSSSAIQFLTAGVEVGRFSPAGYLGIGTSSPGYQLDVSATSSTTVLRIANTANLGVYANWSRPNQSYLMAMDINNNGGTDFTLYNATSSAIMYQVSSSGNLGLGVTPYGWYAGSSAHVFQINNGSFYADSANSVSLASNWGFTTGGAQQYISSSYATRYIQSSGQHIWNVAPSGTAGNAISFTQAMTLTNAGNLGIGTTSPTSISNYTTITLNGTTGSIIDLQSNGTTGSRFQCDTTYPGLALWTASTNPMIFGTNYTERMRIDSSGNLLVGTTSAGVGYASQGIILEPAGYESVNHASGTSSGSAYIAFGYNSAGIGSITQNGTTGVLYNTSSDQRLKTNIVDAPDGNINQIKVRSFDWKADGSHQTYGMIAQELIEVAPYAVMKPKDPDEMMQVDYSKLVPMMIKEIQDLRARLAKAGL